jgi:hypothetical protein
MAGGSSWKNGATGTGIIGDGKRITRALLIRLDY